MRARSKFTKLLVLLVFVLGLVLLNSVNKAQLLNAGAGDEPALLVPAVGEAEVSGTDLLIADAFYNRQSNLQLSGEGQVIRILADDNQGSRHQRFIVQLESGHSLLVAHNIDLAPRVDNLREGQWIEFYGEYEWNEQGGVIHWTHHDPKGKHLGGWLKYEGQVYQ